MGSGDRFGSFGAPRANSLEGPYAGRIDPPPSNWRSFEWEGGSFQVADRQRTATVEGTLCPPKPVLMVTLRGGADRHELKTDDGLRFDGADHAGSASYLPAGCERRLRLTGVEWRWASITLPDGNALSHVPAFCDARDSVLHGLLAELEDQLAHGALSDEYCDAAATMLGIYIGRKYGTARVAPEARPYRLTSFQLRRIADHVAAHLDRPVRVRVLAELVGLSEGHLHRAFRMTTGETPLAYVNRCRVEAAAALMRDGRLKVTEIAAEVGFASPTAFARTFRKVLGVAPSVYRGRARLG
jgi:AraC family transcriptional regulator